MEVSYTAKATSDITCIAETDPEQWTGDDPDLPVRVRGVRNDGTVVIEGVIRLWVPTSRPEHRRSPVFARVVRGHPHPVRELPERSSDTDDQDGRKPGTRGGEHGLLRGRDPVNTAAMTAGLVKGAAEAGVGLVRSTVAGTIPQPRSEETAPAPVAQSTAETPAETLVETDVPEPTALVDAPERDLPGPDIVLAEVPDPADLPEPVVIEADDDPDPFQHHESFQTEPKATTRSDSIGGADADVFEAEDEADEALEEIFGTEPLQAPSAADVERE